MLTLSDVVSASKGEYIFVLSKFNLANFTFALAACNEDRVSG